jgi:amidase
MDPKYSASSSCSYSFGPRFEAAWSVQTKQSLVIETADCFGQRVGISGIALQGVSPPMRPNPATGPFYIAEANPGDTLVVKIERIKTSSLGFLVASPGIGLLGNQVVHPEQLEVAILADRVVLPGAVVLPLRPMVGVVGVATSGDVIPTTTPGPHGGNLDIRDLGPGASILLPVSQPGAGLAIGDLHATQGDGEVMQSAVEVSGEVTVRLRLVRGHAPRWPWIKTRNHWMVATAASTFEEAAAIATEEMARAVVRSSRMDTTHAGMLLSACADLRVNQVVNPRIGVRMALPTAALASFWPLD